MPTFPISNVPANISQSITQNALIQNIGNDTIYLDTHSAVSEHSFGTALLPRSTVNWPANTVLWAVTAAGRTSAASILYNAAGASVGSVIGDVNATITGGTINATIPGKVTVNADGSTINIGNEVRLIGGGDYVSSGMTPADRANFTLNQLISAPFVGRKYMAYRLMIQLHAARNHSGRIRVVDEHTGSEYFTYPVNRGLEMPGLIMLNTHELGFAAPLFANPANIRILASGIQPHDVVGLHLFMDYTPQTGFSLWHDNPGSAGQSLNLAGFGTSPVIVSAQIRPYPQIVTMNNRSAITGIPAAVDVSVYDPLLNASYRTEVLTFNPTNGASHSFIVPPYTFMRLGLGSTAKTGTIDFAVAPQTAAVYS